MSRVRMLHVFPNLYLGLESQVDFADVPSKPKKPRTYKDSFKDLSLEGKVDIDTQGPIVSDTDKPTEGKKEKINDGQGQTGPLSQDLYLEGKSHVEDSPHQLATPSECKLLIKASHH